jgi:hypothetical protein
MSSNPPAGRADTLGGAAIQLNSLNPPAPGYQSAYSMRMDKVADVGENGEAAR